MVTLSQTGRREYGEKLKFAVLIVYRRCCLLAKNTKTLVMKQRGLFLHINKVMASWNCVALVSKPTGRRVVRSLTC
ncbi:Protein apterous [Trichinella spiralis]|uniref:Protein apterous n=1 Tax=Trichinella spiralis TaxID=6334 RepID=A0ABR3KDL4_TRISP